MMKPLLKILLVLIINNNACHKGTADTLPSCIQSKIDSLKAAPKQNPAAEVQLYLYNNKRVYLFNSPCCDQYNAAYDEACNYICAPSGGMTGKGDRKCADFSEKAAFVKVVWKDDR